MKRSNRVKALTLSLVLLTSCTASAKPLTLDGSLQAFDDDKLEKAVNGIPHEDFLQFYGGQSFRANFVNGQSYYLASSSVLNRNENFGGHSTPSGRGWCQFDFFNLNYQYVNGIRVHIKDHEYTNVCNWIYGVSAVTYKNQPALLVNVQYHRGLDPTKAIAGIGNNYHLFTALLILTPRKDGAIEIRQDDDCLGTTNQIETLALAKKRLAECSQ